VPGQLIQKKDKGLQNKGIKILLRKKRLKRSFSQKETRKTSVPVKSRETNLLNKKKYIIKKERLYKKK
jgi:hypothetical protein